MMKAKEEEFEKLMTKQMEETKEVMLDSNISASEREEKTSEISTRYATEMEKIKATQEDKERLTKRASRKLEKPPSCCQFL